MRIISGKHKGKRLSAPKNLPVRPTTDMAKESLFNIINNNYYFENVDVIDLFAGTGNISFEFASRGTSTIYSIDKHFGCVRYINEVSKELNLNINTYKSDVYKFLEKTPLKADIIFADLTVLTIPLSINFLIIKGLYSSAAMFLGKPHSNNFSLNSFPIRHYQQTYDKTY